LPKFAYLHWGYDPHEIGVTFIGVGGKDAYTPFLRLASRFGIPWCILSDGAPGDISAVNNCLNRAGLDQIPANKAVYALPSGHDFEGYIAQPDYHDLLCDMIADYLYEESAMGGGTPMNETGKAALRRTLGSKSSSEIATELRKRRTTFGARVADALNKHSDKEKRVPTTIKQVLNHVRPPALTCSAPISGASNGS
jgi:putative ATP-dependent endonuclease of the OLD family